jgi:hypothetical protein
MLISTVSSLAAILRGNSNTEDVELHTPVVLSESIKAQFITSRHVAQQATVDVLIMCSKPADVTWSRMSDRSSLLLNGALLKITNVSLADSGTYVCTNTADPGMPTHQLTLTVVGRFILVIGGKSLIFSVIYSTCNLLRRSNSTHS